VTTVGTVARVAGSAPAVYELTGGHGKRIVLVPSARAARYDGRQVRVSGIFAATFQLGYEIQIKHMSAGGSL
jgi:hypothetical protein